MKNQISGGMLARVGSAAQRFLTQPRYVSGGLGVPVVNISKSTPQLARELQTSISQSDRPLFTDWDAKQAINHGFKSSHYVAACVKLLAENMARPDWIIETRGSDGEWTPQPDSRFEELMRRPNPFQSGTNLMERAGTHLFLTGNMLLYKVRSATGGMKGKPGDVIELWNLQPEQIKPVPSRTLGLSHYEFTAPGCTTVPLAVEDVIHVMLPNPETPFWGASPLQSMSRIIDTEVDAMNWWRWSIRNRAAKDGFIKYNRMLTDDEYALVKRQLVEQVVGPFNARLPMILGGDCEWVPSSNNALEMDFVDLRKMTREEICGVFGVPPMMLGIMDNSTYNNISSARLALWQDNLVIVMAKLQADFNHQLLCDFISPGLMRTTRTNWDRSEITPLLQQLAELADPVTKYWEMGVPFNELNRRFGLGFKPLPADIGDASWISSSYQTAEQALEPPDPDPMGLGLGVAPEIDQENMPAGGSKKPTKPSKPGEKPNSKLPDKKPNQPTQSKPEKKHGWVGVLERQLELCESL